ncbi:MAG TPA: hypothetical protein VNU26_06770, partial [Mycobacteriales bacterium]|nr:hypothetical protein [Mycobacteriales bacterium]
VSTTLVDAAGNSASTTTSFSVLPSGNGFYVAQSEPVRVLDTRHGTGTANAGKVDGAVVVDLSSRLPASASAAVLNLTALQSTGSGYVVAYPFGTSRPPTSNLNVATGQTQANEAIVAMPADGSRRVVLFANTGDVHLVADLVGSFASAPTAGAGSITTGTPVRVLDTRRTATPVRSGSFDVPLPADAVPAGATSVVLNVTVVGAQQPGYLVVHAGGTSKPPVSNVNYVPGVTQANEVFTRVSADRTVRVYLSGAASVIVDLVGVVRPVAAGTDQVLVPLSAPERVYDSRRGSGPVGPGTGTIDLTSAPEGATGVLLNLTGLQATHGMYVAAFPAGTSWPGTSNLNLAPGLTKANAVMTGIDEQGQVSLRVGGPAGSKTHLVVDVVGYLVG